MHNSPVWAGHAADLGRAESLLVKFNRRSGVLTGESRSDGVKSLGNGTDWHGILQAGEIRRRTRVGKTQRVVLLDTMPQKSCQPFSAGIRNFEPIFIRRPSP